MIEPKLVAEFDEFTINFKHKIEQLAITSDIHPSMKHAISSFHNLVDVDVIPYKIEYPKSPLAVLQKKPVVIAGALRAKNDLWYTARKPDSGELEYLIAVHECSPFILTCPNCYAQDYTFRTFTTEHYAILYCHYCFLFSWKVPVRKLSF